MFLALLQACSENSFFAADDVADETSAALEASTTRLDFGTVQDNLPVTAVLTLTATGTEPVTLSRVGVLGSDAYDVSIPAGTTITPGSVVQVVVTYTPETAGDVGQLVVSSDAAGGSVNVELAGAGIFPELTLDQPAVQLTGLADEPQTATVTVTSSGTDRVEISGFVLEGEAFTLRSDGPASLMPGESTTFDVGYTPETNLSADTGAVWLMTNTAGSYVYVPLRGYGIDASPDRLSLGQAWDDGVLDVSMSGSQVVITNTSAHSDVLVDGSYLFTSDGSQDAAVGSFTGDDAAPRSVMAGESMQFTYHGSSDAWWCVEEKQHSQRGASYTFSGAQVPEPIVTYIRDGDQSSIWAWQEQEALIVVGRQTNGATLSGGGSAEVVLTVKDYGDEPGSVEVRETIPAGLTATGFSVPVRTEPGADGATVYIADIDVDGRMVGLSDGASTYDTVTISYTLAGTSPTSRQIEAATGTWTSSDGTTYISRSGVLAID